MDTSRTTGRDAMTVPDAVYEAAAQAYANALTEGLPLGHFLSDSPPIRATVDAVWALGVAEGRRRAAEDIRAARASTDSVSVAWAARIAAGGD